ncbi:hypothetical protein BFJ66_g17828 [Fusarium oxysporum f. sp. cepae]|nr:hypothetical protein BFJ66_g17828 [Fusarium oxysporum f. sp. cepae]
MKEIELIVAVNSINTRLHQDLVQYSLPTKSLRFLTSLCVALLLSSRPCKLLVWHGQTLSCPTKHAIVSANSHAIDTRSPADATTPDPAKIVDLKVRGIEKRSTQIKLSADTGYYSGEHFPRSHTPIGIAFCLIQLSTYFIKLKLYRVAYKGAVIWLHLFYDLAVNHVVFYWTTGSIPLGFDDPVGGGFP